MVDAFDLQVANETEFGSTVHRCKEIFSKYTSFLFCFVKRQANEVAHLLAGDSCFQTCPFVSFNSPIF